MNINHNNLFVKDKLLNNKVINNNQSSQIKPNFNDIFKNTLEDSKPLQFSKHASMRLNSRNISLSSEQLSRIESGIVDANKKGINDSLVLVDDVALVVNIKSKTVITAMKDERNNIFTNIDGAVIV